MNKPRATLQQHFDETDQEMLTTPELTTSDGYGTETDTTVDEAESPLDKSVPMISTKRIMPLVVSYLERLHSSDISDRVAQDILVKLFLEIIETASNEILAALKEIILQEKEARCLPLISVEAVKKALQCSLCISFKAALGSAHGSMEDLLKLMVGEVASRVNSALSRSKVQDSHLKLEEDSGYKTPRETLKAMAHQARAFLRSIRDNLCTVCGPCGGYAHCAEACPLSKQGSGPPQSTSLTSILEKVQETVQDILEREVIDMKVVKENASSELTKSISADNENTALSIVSIIQDAPMRMCLKGVSEKIKSFFVLCYAKASFYGLSCKLCCKQTPGSGVITDELIKKAFPLFQELTDNQEGAVCIYQKLSRDISSGRLQKLSQQLFELIQNIPQIRLSTSRSTVRAEIDSFMNNILTWLHTQQRHPVLVDPVQRALRRIQRVACKHFPSKIQVIPKDNTAAVSLQYKTVAQTPPNLPPTTKPVQDVPEAPAQPLYVWKRKEYLDLVNEVVSRLLKDQPGTDMKEVVTDLVQRLESTMAHVQGDIQVGPTVYHIENVAKCVLRDLCSKRQKYVRIRVVEYTDYRGVVVDCIRKHLLSPPKSRFSSFLLSVRDTFCQPCRGCLQSL